MKKNIQLLLCLLFSTLYLQAQHLPQGMNYQAVARDAQGQILAEKEIAIQIKLIPGAPDNKAVYTENHFIKTNKLGLFKMIVGEGVVNSGIFNEVPWAEHDIWMAVGIDDEGGTNFKTLTTTRLLTVPYAFHAGSAETLIVHEHDQEKRRCPITGLPFWSILGNDNVTDTCHFLGTTIPVDLVFKTDSIERMRITAAGDIIISDNLIVGNDLSVGNDVSVGNNIDITNNANIGGDLTVGGDGEFYNLNVLNDLTVGRDGSFDRNVSIGKDLDVASNGSIVQNLDIGLNTTIGGRLNVNQTAEIMGNTGIGSNYFGDTRLRIESPSSIDFPFFAQVEGTPNSFFMNSNGQLFSNSTKSGSSDNSANYGFRLDSEDQGMLIRIKDSNRYPNQNNNYITFAGIDDNNLWTIRGRIEGQTLSELHSSFDYIWWSEQEALNYAFQLAMVGVDLVGVDDFDAAVVEGIEMVDIISNWALVTIDWETNVGIAFESGNGDYAEWLGKAYPDETFSYGDVVGVIGGKISKRFTNAKKFMAISKSPIVLGNMPDVTMENQFEKVAFMGQVPVKVRGKVNIGDYILATNLKDGFGKAKHPDELNFEDLDKIVGVAWSASENSNGYAMINVAVGINTNDAAAKLQEQQVEIENLKQQLNTISAYLQAKDPSFEGAVLELEEQEEKTNDYKENEEIVSTEDQIMDQVIALLEENIDMVESIQTHAREILDQKDINYNLFDQTRLMVTDPNYFIQTLEEFRGN